MKTNNWIRQMVLLLSVLLIVWASPGVAQETTSPEPGVAQETTPPGRTSESTEYLIGAGDLIEVVVWKNEDLSGEFRVRPDGKFSMPLIGDIIAIGKTTNDINRQIQTKLQLFIEAPFVSTIVKETISNRVYVLGEVKTPGAYPIEGSLTVLQALSLAGGFTEFAIRDRMVLVRGTGENQQNFTLSYRKILAEPGEKYNMVLQRDDTLVVP